MSIVIKMNGPHEIEVRGTFTACGWEAPRGLTAEGWVAAGEMLVKVEQSKQWWLGDWWNAGNFYGERQEACERIGVEYQTAANCSMVSKAFENFSRRREKLTFKHHAEVCAIDDPAVQDRMLDWCEEPLTNGEKRPKSTSELREQVRAYLDEQGWTDEDRERRDALNGGETIVVNQKTDEKLIRWAQFEGLLVKVDRTTDWGNPFEMPGDGDRDTVCDSFEVYLTLKPSLLKLLPTLKGKALACWCHPQRCHAHHLAELANGAEGEHED